MNEEERKLLIKDLCGREPYHPRINVINQGYEGFKDGEFDTDLWLDHIDAFRFDRIEILPYLRPMSSMTEDEKEELKSKCLHTETEEDWEGVRCDSWGIEILDKYDTKRWDNTIYVSSIINMDAIDWLNAHHFDYRGLIGRGLALEAPEEIYNNKIQEK